MAADTTSETSTETPTEPIHIDGQAHLNDVIDEYDVVLTD
ncbi:MAG: thioredoxin 1, partial [Natronomonas sp.]